MSEEEVKAASFKVEDGSLKINVDTNKDGEAAIKGNLNLGELVQEAIARGDAVEGVKVTEFKFELTKLKLSLDSDKDGEKVLELEIDLGEAFDEVQSAIKKD